MSAIIFAVISISLIIFGCISLVKDSRTPKKPSNDYSKKQIRRGRLTILANYLFFYFLSFILRLPRLRAIDYLGHGINISFIGIILPIISSFFTLTLYESIIKK